ncbi:MAG: nucleoside monophosphate kinase [bacterium]|nr:nucleoside monophosphate kinase [bacterium]
MGKYVIMGIQGSGKGTQAKLLASDYNLVHISMGEVFRGHIRAGTHLGKTIHDLVADGHLVPDSIVNQVLRTRLSEGDCQRGFVLDGYPRDLQQAKYLLSVLQLDAVINVAVPDQVVTARMLDRRICAECGRDWNLQGRQPRAKGVCDDCGGAVVVREDDTPVAIASRLADFRLQTAPVLDFFRAHDLVIDVDGTQAPERVQDEIRRKLGLTVS